MAINSPPPRSPRIDRKIPTYHSVSRRRKRARGCISVTSCAEPVPRATQRRDQLRIEAVVDLATQPPHQHLEDVGEGVMIVVPYVGRDGRPVQEDRKSTRLNSSHLVISYAVFCLKKKNKKLGDTGQLPDHCIKGCSRNT